MIKVTATPKFIQLAKKVMTSEALQELIDELTIAPEKGIIIAGTGGIRKLRWRTGKDNKGKSGGIRVLYYYDNEKVIVLLISLFKKSDRENIDAGEKAELKKLLPELLEVHVHE
jgi:hypothetical protein